MNAEAVGYKRISVHEQSNNSLANQDAGIREYALKNNLTLTKIFEDNGGSGFTFERKAWKELEQYIKTHRQIKYLIVLHIDRFSRATLMDALIKLNEIEVKLKVKVLTVADPINVDNNDLGVQLMRTINLLFSNNERNRIQDRVKDGVYRSLANGRFCNMAPIGYKNSKDAEGKPLLIIDTEKSKHIQKIFRLYNEGMNIEKIRAEVPELNLRGNSAVQRILSNSLYAGIIELPAYKDRPAKEVTAIHKPIVNRYEYYSAKSRINNRHITVQPSHEVWLRGILHCSCGRPMTAGNSRSKSGKYYWYYKCQVHHVNFPATRLHKQFEDILEVLSFSNESIQFIKEKLIASIDEHQSKKGGNIMRLKLDLSKIEKKIQETQAKYLLNQDIDAMVYSKVMTELKQNHAALEERIAKASTDTATMLSMLNDLVPKLINLPEVFSKFTLHHRQLFINVVFSRPVVYFDGIYRTPSIYPLFADKALILKEKRLLEIEQPWQNLENLQTSTLDGNCRQMELSFLDLQGLLIAFAS